MFEWKMKDQITDFNRISGIIKHSYIYSGLNFVLWKFSPIHCRDWLLFCSCKIMYFLELNILFFPNDCGCGQCLGGRVSSAFPQSPGSGAWVGLCHLWPLSPENSAWFTTRSPTTMKAGHSDLFQISWRAPQHCDYVNMCLTWLVVIQL